MNNQRTCRYCMTPIEANEVTASCSQCNSIYHKRCWDANHGCVRFQCQAAAIAPTVDIHTDISFIKENAAVNFCHYCGGKLFEHTKFCAYCGKPILHKEEVPEHQPEKIKKKAVIEVPPILNPKPVTKPVEVDDTPVFGGPIRVRPVDEEIHPFSDVHNQLPEENVKPLPVGEKAFIPLNDDETVFRYFVKNPYYYKSRFKELESSYAKSTFNVAAFFLNFVWLFYRKMYRYGIIFFVINLVFNLISPNFGFVVTIGTGFFLGMQGNRLYKEKFDDDMKAIELSPIKKTALSLTIGGVNPQAAAASFWVYLFILSLLMNLRASL